MVFKSSVDCFIVWKIIFICLPVQFSGAIAIIFKTHFHFQEKTTPDCPPKFLEKYYLALICLIFISIRIVFIFLDGGQKNNFCY